MSESDIESRILGPGWGPRPPAPGPWGRPPAGAWPPCPPGPPGPWPRPPGPWQLEQCWEDVRATKNFLRRMLADIIAEDPSLIGLSQPIIGVTDGTQPQPGQVGEYVQFDGTVPIAAGTSTQSLSVGVLSAGDWDCWTWGYPSVGVDGLSWGLAPVPAGFNGNMLTAFWLSIPEWAIISSYQTRALTTAQSLIAFSLTVTNAAAAGNFSVSFAARRRR